MHVHECRCIMGDGKGRKRNKCTSWDNWTMKEGMGTCVNVRVCACTCDCVHACMSACVYDEEEDRALRVKNA